MAAETSRNAFATHSGVTGCRRSRERPEMSESGQSIMEFLFMLPVLIALSVLMLKMNTAIQVSIVNQQYARAQALWLAFNSPEYPYLVLRDSQLTQNGFNQMLIGVSDNAAPDDNSEYVPKATVQSILSSKRTPAGSDSPQEEPGQRSKVRVRSTVTLCTQTNVISNGGPDVPILPLGGDLKAAARSNLNDNSHFQLCKSPMRYL